MTEKEQSQGGHTRAYTVFSHSAVWIGALIAAAFIGGCVKHHYEVRPPPSVTDFESFLKTMRQPRGLAILKEKDHLILVAMGDLSGFAMVSIPSGPPQYVFGADGKLLDWTPDCGDGKGWNAGPLLPVVKQLYSVSEARAWLVEQKSAAQRNPN